MPTACYALIKYRRITHIVEIPVTDIGRSGSDWERLARRYGTAFVALPRGGQVGNEVTVNRFAEAAVVTPYTADPKTAGSLDGAAIPNRIADDRGADRSGTFNYYNHEGVWQCVEPSLVEHYRCDLGREVIAVEVE